MIVCVIGFVKQSFVAEMDDCETVLELVVRADDLQVCLTPF